MAAGIFCPSPITITCSIKRDCFKSLSNAAGAMYFPPDVLKISFFLSVIFKKPLLSNSPISPVWKKLFFITLFVIKSEHRLVA